MPEGYIRFVASAAEHARMRDLVADWRAEVAGRELEVSRAVAARQRAEEQRLGRQLTADEVKATWRAGQREVLPPHPASAEARFARGEALT